MTIIKLNKIIVGDVELIPRMGGFSHSYEGDETIFTGTTNPQVLALPKRYSCEITVEDGRQTIYQRLFQLAASVYGGNQAGQITAITVQDYINPDSGLVTTRKMLITDLNQVGSSLNKDGVNLSKGTRVRLVSVDRSVVM